MPFSRKGKWSRYNSVERLSELIVAPPVARRYFTKPGAKFLAKFRLFDSMVSRCHRRSSIQYGVIHAHDLRAPPSIFLQQQPLLVLHGSMASLAISERRRPKAYVPAVSPCLQDRTLSTSLRRATEMRLRVRKPPSASLLHFGQRFHFRCSKADQDGKYRAQYSDEGQRQYSEPVVTPRFGDQGKHTEASFALPDMDHQRPPQTQLPQ